MLNIDNNYMLIIVCYLFLWLFGLAPSNPGFQELNNQLRTRVWPGSEISQFMALLGTHIFLYQQLLEDLG